MGNKIQSNCGEPMDITYNEDKTIMTMFGRTEHGGVMTRVAMYDSENRPAPMHRATLGMLMELDAMYNIVHQQEVSIHWDADQFVERPLFQNKPHS